MFKRKNPRSLGQMATEMVYPPGGWKRSSLYMWHRLRRLPDRPHRIGRGMAAGLGFSCTPFFGFHLLGSALVAWLIGGNIIAAFLGTFIVNPVTGPLVAISAVTLGRWILGSPGELSAHVIVEELAQSSGEIWNNLLAAFTDRTAHWGHLEVFFHEIYLPFVVGGAVLGVVLGVITHYITVSIVHAYQEHRSRQMAQRIARARAAKPEV